MGFGVRIQNIVKYLFENLMKKIKNTYDTFELAY